LSLLGHLHFHCKSNHPGRSFVTHLITLSTKTSKLHHHIYIERESIQDLKNWSDFMNQGNCISDFLEIHTTTAPYFDIYTDGIGYGGFFKRKWFKGN